MVIHRSKWAASKFCNLLSRSTFVNIANIDRNSPNSSFPFIKNLNATFDSNIHFFSGNGYNFASKVASDTTSNLSKAENFVFNNLNKISFNVWIDSIQRRCISMTSYPIYHTMSFQRNFSILHSNSGNQYLKPKFEISSSLSNIQMNSSEKNHFFKGINSNIKQNIGVQMHEYSIKVKKIKIKPYSSFKRRFKLLADGTFKRWKAGKRHNASTKTKKQRRQLRVPTIVSKTLTGPMKKLNFKL